MPEPRSLTRQDLDRLKIGAGEGPSALGCNSHPAATNTVLYEDGHLRLLCVFCGFESMRIKVAVAGDVDPGEVDDPPTPGICRECGCTQDRACSHEDLGACSWVEPDLCSACTPNAGEGWEHPPPLRELGRLCPPYGGIERCAADICKSPQLGEEKGAYMYRDLEGGKLVIFCGDCARHVELNRPERFRLVAL